jgi:hypothetical protein
LRGRAPHAKNNAKAVPEILTKENQGNIPYPKAVPGLFGVFLTHWLKRRRRGPLLQS